MIESMIFISAVCFYMSITFGLSYLFFKDDEATLYCAAWMFGLVLFVLLLLAAHYEIGKFASDIPMSVYEQLIQ